MLDRLIPCATGFLLLQHAESERLALHYHHDDSNGERNTGDDDTKCAEGPSEIEIRIEQVRNPGTGKRTRDRRGSVHAKHDHTVLQRCHVRNHDVDNVGHADVAGPVQRMGSKVSLDIFADSLHNHAHNDNQEHKKEAGDTAPNIDNLSNGESCATAKNRRDDTDTGEKTMAVERRRNIGV